MESIFSAIFLTTYFFDMIPSRQSISMFEAILPTYFNISSPIYIFLTNSNYFSWKYHMEMYYEVKDFTELPWENKLAPLMTKKKQMG
jgi:hypothetical protein